MSRDDRLHVGVLLHRRVLGLLDHQPLRAGPRALAPERERRGDLRAVADAAGREHGNRRDLLDHLRPEHDRADLAAVAATLATLGDDDVDAGVGVLAGLVRRTAQRRDLAAFGVDVLDHVGRRRAERVRDQHHLRVRAARSRPAASRWLRSSPSSFSELSSPSGVGTPWSFSSFRAKSRWACGHHVLEHLREVLGGQVRVHALVLVRDHDVDAVGQVADVLVDPVELDLELLGAEAHRAEHAEPAGLAHRDDDVTAVGEGEDRELDAELVADRGAHGRLLLDVRCEVRLHSIEACRSR